MNAIKSLLYTAIIFAMLPGILKNTALSQYELDNETSFIQIAGTSTMHDWTADVEQMSGTLKCEIEKAVLTKLNSISVNVTVNSIKSGKSKMDANMRKALNAKEHPKIIYTLRKYSINKSEVTLTGDLTVAGVTQSYKTKVVYAIEGKHIKLSGSFKLNMSDFDIEPPEFLMGAFKVGDQVTLNFFLMFTEKD